MPLRHRVHAGTEFTNSSQTFLTFGDNLVEGGAILWGFILTNRDSAQHRVTVHLVPSGGSPTETNCIFELFIPPNDTVGVNGPFHEDSGATVRGISDAADPNCGIRITASEEFISG